MITPEEMLEMAERMDDMMECWLDGGCMSEADNCKDAAAMLRSIAAEREADGAANVKVRFDGEWSPKNPPSSSTPTTGAE